MDERSYLLGVDGGATKTHALVMEATGHVVGFGAAGTGNHQVVGLESALRELERAATAAMAGAAISPENIQLGYFCLAGADLPEDYTMLREAIQGLGLARSIIVKNDTMAALRSGLTRSWGVVVVCGTGFNAAGRSPDGTEILLPGLGPISGDWGGGYALGQEIIRLVMRAWDGRGKPTLLTERVLEALQMPSIEALLSNLYHQKISQRHLLDLVPLLFEAAEASDEVARDLIVRMGTEIGVTANALIRRLSLQAKDVEVVLAGGVFKGKGSLLLDTVTRIVLEEAQRARIVKPGFEPVVGAALLAMEAIGVTVDEQHYQRLRSTLPASLVLRMRQRKMLGQPQAAHGG